jgi:hypothetical protein
MCVCLIFPTPLQLAGLPGEPGATLVYDYPVKKVPLLLQLVRRSGVVPDEMSVMVGGTTAHAGLVSSLLAGWLGVGRGVGEAASSGAAVAAVMGGGAEGVLSRVTCLIDGDVKAYSLEADLLSSFN